jgi:murein L,D-transpeptidase YafK
MLLVALALLLGQASQPGAQQATRIVVEKNAHKMTLFAEARVLHVYQVALGGQPVGAKTREGDHRTPEGVYVIDYRQPASKYHLALHVSYPNESDRARARKLGVDPGGAIMIHGLDARFAYFGVLHRWVDWTDGCVAVTNSEIEEIFRLVPVGTPVEIRP